MRKWLHRALKGASLTTALFVFQACYGTPPGPYMEEMETTDVELVEEAPAAEADGEVVLEDAEQVAE